MSDIKRPDPEIARRALAEAVARRKESDEIDMPPEKGGRANGTEPVRYGDWEKNGLAIDF